MSIIANFSGNIPTGGLAPKLTTEQQTKWSTNIKAAVSEIANSVENKIPDEQRYQSKVVESSVANWNAMYDRSFVSKKLRPASVVIATRTNKLTASYNKYKTGLKKAYATQEGIEAKNFKDSVDANAPAWAQNVAAYGMPFTGSGKSGKGPVVFIQNFLTGNPNYIKSLQSGWTYDGLVNIVQPGTENAFKAMVAGFLTQMMNFASTTNFDPSTLNDANAKIVTIMNALLNTDVANLFAAPDASPNSSLILSAGESVDLLHIECIVRFGTR